MLRRSDRLELKIISLTLEKLLRNLPRLGGVNGCAQGRIPFRSYASEGTLHEHGRASQRHIKIWLNPPAFGGLTEVNLGTSLPSRVPESRCLPYSTTLHELPGGQALGWMNRRVLYGSG